MTVVTKTSMRVINGCLIVGLVASLLPQVLPNLQVVSAILIIGSGVAAFCAFLFGQTTAEGTAREEVRALADQRPPAIQDAPAVQGDPAIQGAPDVYTDQMSLDEVFLPEFAGRRSVTVDPVVWLSELADIDRLATANLNRTIYRLHGQHHFKLGSILLWFDEKNSNVQIAPITKLKRKVPRSLTPFEGLQMGRSRTVH